MIRRIRKIYWSPELFGMNGPTTISEVEDKKKMSLGLTVVLDSLIDVEVINGVQRADLRR
ncbi:hypothetical protein ACH0F8_000922 [Enterococcus hirae]|nr:hypothetical protein [Enterococcus hirae]EMF0047687.1 hypothetical protein [Enterococcus hirae]EMF0159679.1 hypothetical protein [Enterococcus hirae]